jgi:pSer/pThr/pTyr-binding forkhead associated (FHA) protein
VGPSLDFADRGGTVPITKPEAIIGRHSDDDIRIPDVRVSRHHARLTSADGHYEIHNLTAVRSEPNPLLVNGVEKEHAQLHDGDEISLGGVKFTFKAAAWCERQANFSLVACPDFTAARIEPQTPAC